MTKAQLFTAAQFTATEHGTSAEEKAKWANDLVAWVQKGFPQQGFTNRFYEGFHVHMSWSAEYNKQQFYQTWFSSEQAQLNWLREMTTATCLGSPQYTWSDVERSLKSWIQQRKLVQERLRSLKVQQEQSERETLKRLLLKYPDVLLEMSKEAH